MPRFDLPLEQLHEYRTETAEPRVVAVGHADVPLRRDIQRAITLAPEAPYTEVPEFGARNVNLIPATLEALW